MPTASYLFVQKALQTTGVRRKLSQVADRKAAAARSIIAAQGAKVAVQREDGTRPKGRPYSRISVPAANEFGTSWTARMRILGQVINR
jgi:hypothetical protein